MPPVVHVGKGLPEERRCKRIKHCSFKQYNSFPEEISFPKFPIKNAVCSMTV